MTEPHICNNCARPLGQAPPSAPHKRFCSASCRNEYHAKRRRIARQLLDELEQELELAPVPARTENES